MATQKETLINQILEFDNYHEKWDGRPIRDPYLRDFDFVLREGISLPDQRGVYMFKSIVSGETYYIGKAKDSLSTRLTGKMKADIKEKRVRNYRNDDRKLFHDYPYLPIYDEEESEVYFLAIRNDDKASVAERILISAFVLDHDGLMPEGNRTGIPAFAKINDEEIEDILLDIADRFKLRDE